MTSPLQRRAGGLKPHSSVASPRRTACAAVEAVRECSFEHWARAAFRRRLPRELEAVL